MSFYRWNILKNEWLKKERDISFEEAVWHIEHGDLLDEQKSNTGLYQKG
jgi:hypothetical protein